MVAERLRVRSLARNFGQELALFLARVVVLRQGPRPLLKELDSVDHARLGLIERLVSGRVNFFAANCELSVVVNGKEVCVLGLKNRIHLDLN